MTEIWNTSEGKDGDLIFTVEGLDQDYLFETLRILSKYMVCFEEEYDSEFDLEFFTIMTQAGKADCYKFYTNLPYSLF